MIFHYQKHTVLNYWGGGNISLQRACLGPPPPPLSCSIPCTLPGPYPALETGSTQIHVDETGPPKEQKVVTVPRRETWTCHEGVRDMRRIVVSQVMTACGLQGNVRAKIMNPLRKPWLLFCSELGLGGGGRGVGKGLEMERLAFLGT